MLPENVETPATTKSSKSARPSTSKSPFMSAPVAVIIPYALIWFISNPADCRF